MYTPPRCYLTDSIYPCMSTYKRSVGRIHSQSRGVVEEKLSGALPPHPVLFHQAPNKSPGGASSKLNPVHSSQCFHSIPQSPQRTYVVAQECWTIRCQLKCCCCCHWDVELSLTGTLSSPGTSYLTCLIMLVQNDSAKRLSKLLVVA